MDEDHFYNYDVLVHGKCCQCGQPLKENEGIFLCDKCKEENRKYYEKREVDIKNE